MKEEAIKILTTLPSNFYRCSSGVVKMLRCKQTNRTLISEPTDEQFYEAVVKFFR